MNAKNNPFITLTSENKITVITNSNIYIHALRFLRNYFTGFQLEMINIDNYSEEIDLIKNRSEEHTSELQSLAYLLFPLLL